MDVFAENEIQACVMVKLTLHMKYSPAPLSLNLKWVNNCKVITTRWITASSYENRYNLCRIGVHEFLHNHGCGCGWLYNLDLTHVAMHKNQIAHPHSVLTHPLCDFTLSCRQQIFRKDRRGWSFSISAYFATHLRIRECIFFCNQPSKLSDSEYLRVGHS